MDYMEIAKRLRNYEWERDDDGKCYGCPDEESYYPCCVDCFSRTHLQAADAIEELQRQIDGWIEQERNVLLKSVPKWIPVTERLPIGGDDSGAICENVCLLMDDGTVSCGWMNGITKKVYYLNAIDDVIIKAPITRVTHWMPLPEPPKEET